MPNEIERMNQTQEKIAKAINESNLPLSTIYMILADFQRQVGDVIAQASAEEKKDELHEDNVGER